MRKKTVQCTVFADVATSVSEAIGAEAPGQNPFQRAKLKESTFLRLVLLIFCIEKGFEQGGSGAEENSPVDCFCRRGNERSEAIGAEAPRQNPFQRAKLKESTFFRLVLLIFYIGKGFEQIRIYRTLKLFQKIIDSHVT